MATAKKPASSSATKLDPTEIRRIVQHAQGLDHPRGDALPDLVARTGFIRTLGGVDGYISLLARHPQLQLAEVDRAVSSGALRVTPAARGCIYLVAEAHATLCLAIAEQLSASRDQRDAEKAGIKKGELEKLGAKVVETLAKHGPATTDVLRKRLPEGSVRSLGEQGKKIGVSSPLPPALRKLEFAGQIERTLEAGRIDTERYQWRARKAKPSKPIAKPHEAIAKLFFAWAGVATLKEFAAWSGFAVKDAKAACEAIALREVVLEDGPGFADPDALEAGGDDEAVALLTFEDNLTALGGGPARWIATKHHGITVPQWGSSKSLTIADSKHMQLRTVLAGGSIVGFWEYDPDKGTAVTALLDKVGKPIATRIAREADRVGTFLREDVGHGRSFSLDTDDALRERVAFIRTLAK